MRRTKSHSHSHRPTAPPHGTGQRRKSLQLRCHLGASPPGNPCSGTGQCMKTQTVTMRRMLVTKVCMHLERDRRCLTPRNQTHGRSIALVEPDSRKSKSHPSVHVSDNVYSCDENTQRWLPLRLTTGCQFDSARHWNASDSRKP